MPFIEKVAPNVVVESSPRVFGVTLGTGLAQPRLEVLLHKDCHSIIHYTDYIPDGRSQLL